LATLATAATERASIEAFRRDVIDASMASLVIVDFWAEWCGPCKALGPVIEKVAADYAAKGVKLVKIDVDKNQTIAAQFRIQSIPTVYAIFQGQPVADLTPARTEGELTRALDALLAQLPLGGGAPGTADLEPIIESAAAALAEGAYAEAEQVYAALVAELPERNDLKAGHARALLGLSRLAEAEAVLAAIPAEAKDAGIAQARAALALAKEMPAGADLTALKAKVAADSSDLAAKYDLAGALMAAGDRDAAADALLGLIAADRTWNEAAAQARLLKLFEAVGLEDPWVMSTRRRLSAILFS
jgi:putative thioredoxin